MKKLNNNDKLKLHLRQHNGQEKIGYSGTQLASVPQPTLIEWVDRISGAGTAASIIGQDAVDRALGAPTSATNEHVDLNGTDMNEEAKKLKAIRDLLGGGSADPDQIRDMVHDVIKDDVSPVIEEIKGKVDALSPLAETLEKIADAMSSGTSSRLPIATAVASGRNPILEMVAPFYKAGATNPTKVCISAPPSYGKSYSIGLLGESYDTFLTHGCNGDLDEWSMLLGSCTPNASGGFIVVDGTLTQAVRSASEGKDTLLFLDEVFRMSATTMEAMLSFLAPQPNASGDLVYRLTTKQNASGVLEVLECSADKLHIVCATNLSTVQPPEAFLDRFLMRHVRYSATMISQIGESVADRYSISDAEVLATKFASAMSKSREMFAKGQLQKPLSIRDLERGCVHADSNDAPSVLTWIRENGMDALLMWQAETGDIIADSDAGVDQLKKILA